MKIQVQLTEDDYVASRWLTLRPRPWLQVTGWIVLATLAFGIFVGVQEALQKRTVPIELWWEIGGVIYAVVWFFVLTPAGLRKVFLQQKTLQRLFELEFTETHFSGVSENGSFTAEWSDFIKWKKNKRLVLIYQSDAIAHFIPLRSFSTPEDKTRFEELLHSKLGAQKA